MATGVIFYPRSVGTAHHAYHRDNLPGGEEFEAKAANSFTLTDKPGRSNPVSIKPQKAGRSKVPYPQPTETIPMTVIPYASDGLRLVWLEILGDPEIQGLDRRKNKFPVGGVMVQKLVPKPLVMV